MANMYQYPKYYEIIFGRRDIKKECQFIQELIKKFARRRIDQLLDIACGTGPHMEELMALGYKTAGLDISPEMLTLVKKKLRGKKNFLGIYEADMEKFILPKKFDLCLCMVNSLEILTENKQFLSHLNSVANCLNLGGLYIIELDSPSFILSNPRPGERVKKYTKKFLRGKIKIRLTYERYPFDLGNFLERNKLILKINDNGKKITLMDNSPVRRLTPSDIDLFSKLNGRMELVGLWGGFDLEIGINDADAEKMIVVLRKLA